MQNGAKTLAAGLVGLAVVAASHGPAWAVPSAEFTLTGNVADPGTYTAATLALLPQSGVSASYTAGGSPVADSYTGVTLWNLLAGAGGVVTNPGVKNDVLRNVVLATGNDGYAAVYALGEIAPNFGNRQYLVATGDTGGQLGPGGPDGFARTVVPGDLAGGRYVSNLSSLTVIRAPTVPVTTSPGVSSALTISGNVASTRTFALPDLESLAPTTKLATYTAGGTSVTDTYTGVSLWTLLNDDGLLTNPTIKNDVLRDFVVATGSDGYEAVISLGEIDPAFGDQPDLVAYADTDGQLGGGGPDGFARLVVPGDIAGGRYVSNLVSLEVIDATTIPEPATWALLAAAVAGLAAMRTARRGRGRVA